MSRVIVALDREKAQKWTEGDDELLNAEAYIGTQVDIALDTDRDELIERVMVALWASRLGCSPDRAADDLAGESELLRLRRKAYRDHAEAVLAVIEGEGETNG